ncbi:MAG: hypothetical protein IJ666_06130 [Ruminococcus sp.]|nr:hypothetical protein [Ruminococcus sp.]
MNIDEKTVRETEIKTVAYLLSVFMGIIIPNTAAWIYLLFNKIIEYFTYRSSDDDFGATPHIVYPEGLCFCGLVCIAFLLVFILSLRAFIKKIKTSENKSHVITVSVGIIAVFVFGLGYFSVCLFASVYNIFYSAYFA